jgi:hypothetical protein
MDNFDPARLLAAKPIQPANNQSVLWHLAWQGGHEHIARSSESTRTNSGSSVGQITGTIHALFARKGDIGVQQLGGAVMIIRVYSNLLKDDDGWRRVVVQCHPEREPRAAQSAAIAGA